MKTIFITIFEGVEAKNILRTPIFKNLFQNRDLRFVFFTKSQDKVDYYKKEFNDPRISYEVVDRLKVSGLDKFFSLLKFQLLKTQTTDLRRHMKFQETGNFFSYYGGLLINRLIARLAVLKLAQKLDWLFVKNNSYSRYFDLYKPDLVLLAHLFDEQEIHLLREAKKRKVTTVGFINSWDKITARCVLRLVPDKFVVFNNIVKKELIDYNGIYENNIFVGGIPQYDFYINGKPSPKEAFYKHFNFNAKVKRIIIYAPNGRFSMKADGPMIDLLHSFMEKKLLPEDVGLLVRFQPNDIVNMDEIRKRPWLIYDIPGKRFSNARGVDWDMDEQDLQKLYDTLFYSTVFVCYTSSLSVDAAAFNKPVININFELSKITPLAESPIQYYQMTHYLNVLNTGGIKVVDNQAQLLEWLNLYLDDQKLDEAGRNRLVAEQCFKLDGKSGERIANFLLRCLNN